MSDHTGSLKSSSAAPDIITFGCRLNSYESEVMRGHAAKAGLTDTVIINTCAVTAEAERQARQAIRRVGRDRPTARIIVTGCAAQINPDAFAAMKEVNHVLGNDAKLQENTFAKLAFEAPRLLLNDLKSLQETAGHLGNAKDLDGGFAGQARAYLQVQNGCDHRCTFCIIPYGRGPSRSVPIGVIVDEARKLISAGWQELVLTGVDMTSYGADLPGTPSLGQMIKRLLALVPELPRLRLSSIDPAEIDQDLWQMIETEQRLMPHLHLSVQAGDDLILKRMKRRHLRKDVLATAARARSLRPDMVLGADLIAGFPTETDEMFKNSLDLIEEAGLSWLHVFPYSARTGTPAAKMPQIPLAVRKTRAAALRAAGEKAVTELLKHQLGKTQQLLVEQPRIARSPHYAPVRLDQDAKPGAIVMAHISSVSETALQGTLLS